MAITIIFLGGRGFLVFKLLVFGSSFQDTRFSFFRVSTKRGLGHGVGHSLPDGLPYGPTYGLPVVNFVKTRPCGIAVNLCKTRYSVSLSYLRLSSVLLATFRSNFQSRFFVDWNQANNQRQRARD